MNEMRPASPKAEPAVGADFRPSLTFTVGVVGHRELRGADRAAVSAEAARLFSLIASAVQAFQTEDAASGASAYAAKAPVLRCLSGLAEGADCLLAEAALQSSWSLVAILPFAGEEFAKDFSDEGRNVYRSLLPRAASVCELSGDLARGAETYVEAGDFVVEHADLIVALWDGQPARGPGGTADVVARALRAGKPLLVMPPADPAALRWLGGLGEDTASVVRHALATPREGEFPKAYFEDQLGSSDWAIGVVRLMDRVLAAGASAPALPGPRPPSPASLPPSALKAQFDRADRLAIAYGARYRAAGLFRYGLILPAVAAALIANTGGRPLEIAGNFAEFLVLVVLVLFSSARWQGLTHERFVSYRLLAEELRCAMLLERFSALPPWRPSDWTAWLTEAYARSAYPATVRLDQARLRAATDHLRCETYDQIAYLLMRATRYELAAKRLSRIGIALSMLGVVFSGLRALFLLADLSGRPMLGLNLAGLILPSLAPVFLGLLSFNEYRRNSARYRSIAAQLQDALAALDKTPLERPALLLVANRISSILRSESADWRTLTRFRSVSAF